MSRKRRFEGRKTGFVSGHGFARADPRSEFSPALAAEAISPRYTFHTRMDLSSQAKTFYIETFGCQMNFHDSEKVVGSLISQGYRQVQCEEDADLIFYNTCSIRDKAEQKVFHRLADFKKLQ
jgi:hypothetical protein